MRTYVNNYEDYCRRKLSGDDVVSVATKYGFEIMSLNMQLSQFVVLELNKNDYSFYEYEVIKSKFRVKEYSDAISYNITEVITNEMLQDEALLRWWNSVFYEQAGIRYYDKEYDTLRIANDCNTVFKDVIKEFSNSVSLMDFPKKEFPIFLTGDLAENPLLQYVLQQQFSMKEIMVLTCKEKEDLAANENDIVVLPESKLNELKLNTNTPISLASIVSKPVRITLPLDSISSVMVLDKNWEDVLADKQKDYSVGNMDFKVISLHVECDPFQNIFLASRDIRGNRKVIQIK